MNKPVTLLLATTALTQLALGQAGAATLVESQLAAGVFSNSLSSATPVSADVTEVVGDVPHYAGGYSTAADTPDFLDIAATGFQSFRLDFTASQVSNGSGIDYYPLDRAVSGSGGGLRVTPLTFDPGVLVVSSEGFGFSGSMRSMGLLSVTPVSLGSGVSLLSSEGMGLPVYPTQLDPILSFYDGTHQAAQFRLVRGESGAVTGTLSGTSDLLVSVATPFDYTVGITLGDPVPTVPEPSGAAVLGLGAAGLLAARRRKRVL